MKEHKIIKEEKKSLPIPNARMEKIVLECSKPDKLAFKFFFFLLYSFMSVSNFFFSLVPSFLSFTHMPVLALGRDMTANGGARSQSRNSSCLL